MVELSDVTDILKASSGRSEFLVDHPLSALGVDSVAILDLVYEIDDRFGVDLFSESALIGAMATTSLRDLTEIVNCVLAQRSDAATVHEEE